jgi:DNA-binding transcriptional regulator WhiA
MSACFNEGMPIYKTKNEHFFKTWSNDMAYVLGFFAADGSMYRTRRGTHFIEFQITDEDLLLKIQKALWSNHKITQRTRGNKRHKSIYRLQIGSKEIFSDFSNLGMT